jgi:ankyrin repeat protein
MRNGIGLALPLIAGWAMCSSSALAAPIHEAAMSGDLEKVKDLLKKDPALADSVDPKDWFNPTYSPLHYAADRGYLDIVKVLLDAKANPSRKNREGATPLHLAVWSGYKEIAALLLAKGADIDVFTAAGLGMTARLAAFLKADKKALRTAGPTGGAPLHWAARNGQIETAKLLLDRKADIDGRDSFNRSALHEAAGRGQREMAKMLLSLGADIEAKNACGETPLFYAVKWNHVGVAKLLIDKRADVNAQEDILYVGVNADAGDPYPSEPEMSTPLHLAARCGHDEVAALLIRSGANVNARDKRGDTPLHVAAWWGEAAVVEALLAGHADVNVKNKGGETALKHVRNDEKGKAVAETLRRHSDDK